MKIDIFNTNKKYNIIYADPPWTYNDKKCNGNCISHYNTMNINDICNLPIKNLADKDCILFIWVTYPMLEEGLKAGDLIIKQLLFNGLNKIKVVKDYFGLGRWTRGNTECCLLAVKGNQKE